MDDKATISVQIPQEWKHHLEAEAAARFLKLSDVIRLILVDHLNKTSQESLATRKA